MVDAHKLEHQSERREHDGYGVWLPPPQVAHGHLRPIQGMVPPSLLVARSVLKHGFWQTGSILSDMNVLDMIFSAPPKVWPLPVC